MKAFEDIPFNNIDTPKGIQALLSFGNEYELSIVKTDFSYGGDRGLYEIGVFKNNQMVEMPGITADGDTVVGFLNEQEVMGILLKMQTVTGHAPEKA